MDHRYDIDGKRIDMTFTLPKVSNKAGASIPEGTYIVTLKAMEKEFQQDGPYGPQDRVKWIFTINEVVDADDEESEGKVGEELWAFTSLKMGPKATMRKFTEALLGRTLDEDEEIGVDDLLGRRARAFVIPHTKQDNTKTTKLDRLSAIKKRRAASDEDELF